MESVLLSEFVNTTGAEPGLARDLLEGGYFSYAITIFYIPTLLSKLNSYLCGALSHEKYY